MVPATISTQIDEANYIYKILNNFNWIKTKLLENKMLE